jgi:hypothetical protein
MIIDEHPILATDINQEFEMVDSTFSDNNNQSSDQSDNEQDFPNEIYRDFVKLVSINAFYINTFFFVIYSK